MLTFLQRAEALSVDNHVLFGRIIFALNEFRPDPQTFGTGIDGGANLKSIILVEEYSVENVAFTGSIFSNNSNYTDVFLLVDLGAEPFDGLLIDG